MLIRILFIYIDQSFGKERAFGTNGEANSGADYQISLKSKHVRQRPEGW